MIAALLGLDATGWAVLTGLVALGVVAVLAVALTVGLIVGRVIRARDRQIPGDRCAAPGPVLTSHPPRYTECVLPAGHRTRWHQDETGMQWTPTSLNP